MNSTEISGILIHNFYRSNSPSGENLAVLEYEQILKSICTRFETLYRYSDNIEDFSLMRTLSTVLTQGSPKSVLRDLTYILDNYKYNFINFHNLYPLIGSDIIPLAKSRNVKVIFTVHNYRFQCLSGSNFRRDQLCLKCPEAGSFKPGVFHSCFQDSFLKSFILSRKINRFRNLLDDIDAFFVLSKHSSTALQKLGIPEKKILLGKNYSNSSPEKSSYPPGKSILFVGRLDNLKGIVDFIASWRKSKLPDLGWKFRIAGSGPNESKIISASSMDSSIQFLGNLTKSQLSKEYEDASYVVIPSRGFEGFPLVIPEALSHGRPVIASEIGSLSSILNSDFGILMRPTEEDQVATLNLLPYRDWRKLSKNAYQFWESNLDSSLRLEHFQEMLNNVISD